MMRQTQQPQQQQQTTSTSATTTTQKMEQPSKIFLNPKFAKAHINPKFLAKQETLRPEMLPQEVTQPQPTIHVNPAFLMKLQTQQVPSSSAPAASKTQATPFSMPSSSVSVASDWIGTHSRPAAAKVHCAPANPIIKNTKRKLIRAATASPAFSSSKHPFHHQLPDLAPMVKIGKNKLIRSTVPSMTAGWGNVKPTIVSVLPQRRSLKIDRRLPKAMLRDILPAKPSFVKRYALSRIDGITTRRVVITDPKLLKLKRKTSIKSFDEPANSKAAVAYASKNKKLVLVNINGVLYRSSTNKLQKSIPAARPPAVQPVRKGAKEQVLVIRGTRFALDRTGMRLRTIAATGDVERKVGSLRAPEPHRMHRIDIGGLTYKARKDGTFVRTDVHRTRNHLSVAKQRSLQVLTSRLRKCNEPCHIYRRLGKCLAHSRGKCPKLHDPKHISICRKFLSGECTVKGCLLSHNVTLEKMPVCRFFLEGRCVRDDCPYLHKKVSEKERICDAFLNGFCPLADKCPNRHVFQCPEFERNGRCERLKCPYPHGRKEIKPKPTPPRTAPKDSDLETRKLEATELPVAIVPVRYYRDDTTGETGELSVSDRRQLTRMLGAVDKMKKRHGEDSACVSIETDVATPREAVASSDESPEQSFDGEVEAEEDTRPPVLRRKKLGTLPSFIPI
ncbi:hypothetical protein AND_000822 [Anopheles darlingi]|uniref:C3H1-type domain-containing protein n=1 Tax=Anopheles darlingi TaxID=43151 RepID=W5JWJ2_ANODA|nr:hypothetical protein AND_000822 [Anopheles darlingi]